VQQGDPSLFEYHVAYLLPWKDAFVPHLRGLRVETICLDGAKGFGWARRLKRFVRDRRIDIVHVHSPYVAAVARSTLDRRAVRLVTTEHNVWERYHRATYWANAATFARNDHVFAVSDEVRRSIRYPGLMRFLPLPTIETLHHGIDVDRVTATPPATGVREQLGIPAGSPVVVTVANFKPHKGHEHLLQVAAAVVRVRPDVRFVLVGDGPLKEALRREAARLGVEKAVVFAGFREDALRIVRGSDVFAMSSIQEGLPLALLEAMALGCPPVATRVGGVSAVIEDAVNGFIVEPRDSQTQAERILKILDDGALRGALGVAARERAGQFHVWHAARRIERVYSELVP